MHRYIDNLFMETIGLSANLNGYIYDQDTRQELFYNDKRLVKPNDYEIEDGCIAFSMVMNKSILYYFFDYYCTKLQNEIGFYISSFDSFMDLNNKSNMYMILRISDNGEEIILKTLSYKNEYLRYLEMCLRLEAYSNGDEFIMNLSNLDEERLAPITNPLKSKRHRN